MAQLLRDQKRSYIIVSPKLTKIDDKSGSAYLTVFAREKSPLEKLFAGHKLFLSPASVATIDDIPNEPMPGFEKIDVQLIKGAGTEKGLANQIKALIKPISRPKPAVSNASKPWMLYVEDDAALRAINVQYFESVGYNVVEANSADQALEELEKRKGAFHLIISDGEMPTLEAGGIKLFRAVRDIYPALLSRFVFYSGLTSDKKWLLLKYTD